VKKLLQSTEKDLSGVTPPYNVSLWWLR